MKKYDINPQESISMNFDTLHTEVMKKVRKVEQECGLDKKMRQAALKKMNQHKETSIKSDLINIQTDDTFLKVIKLIEELKQQEEFDNYAKST